MKGHRYSLHACKIGGLLLQSCWEACSCVDKLISNSSLSSPRLISNYSIAKRFVPMINFSQDYYKQLIMQ